MKDLYTRKEKLPDGRFQNILLYGDKFKKNQQIDKSQNIKTMNFHENLSRIMYEQIPDNLPLNDESNSEKIKELRSNYCNHQKYFEIYYALLQQNLL